MKPIRIVIEGVNSFTDAQELDFDAVGRANLFCIAGRTGAGKTTIFDSIMLALYGKSGKGDLPDVINLSRNSCSVTFEFEEKNELYRVERTIKCRSEKNSGGERSGRRVLAGHESVLYKNGAPVANGPDDVTACIKAAIGMEPEEFKNVYMLEQGEYDEFLKKSPAKQLETVGRIFDLTRFGSVFTQANKRYSELAGRIETDEKILKELGNTPDSDLKSAKAEIASLRGKLRAASELLASLRGEVAALEKTRDLYRVAQEKQRIVAEHAVRLDAAREKLKSADGLRAAFERDDRSPELAAEIEKLREDIAALSALCALDRELAGAEREAAQKRELAAKKHAAEKAAGEKLEKLKAKCAADADAFRAEIDAFLAAAGGVTSPSDTLACAVGALGGEGAAERVAGAYYELCNEKNGYDALCKEKRTAASVAERSTRAAEEELKKVESYAAERRESAVALEAAAREEKAAEVALDRAQLESQAAAVRAELKEGDVCPVCGGTYHGGAHAETDVERYKAELAACQKARKECEKRDALLEKLADKAKSEYERRAAERDEAQKNIAELEQRISATGVNDSYDAMLKALAAAKTKGERSAASQRECDAALPALATAGAESRAADAACDEAAKKAEELRSRLGDKRGRAEGELAAAKAGLAELEKQKASYEDRARKLAAERDAAAAAVATVEDMLAAARRDCPASVPEFDEDAYRQKRADCDAATENEAKLRADIENKEHSLIGLEGRLEQLKSIRAELTELNKKADLYKIIMDMTKKKAMVDFVATEYIQSFTAEASDIIGGLSAGKYSLSYDERSGFMISDYLNDGKSRKTGTLSGGERFLASLAVAIAISHAQGDTGDKEFFFLDEGFGTLDDDRIDIVYSALEELARTCLVGVISHSSALIERMPACVEVSEATDTTGSRIS